jgi:ATPase subunit of ABC transporter with duplicated ATPase domains
MLSDTNSKKEEKIAELEAFVARFSANASKSKQATSRKKMLEKITLDDIKPTSRKYPFIMLEPGRDIGKDVVKVENVSKTIDGVEVLKDISFNITGGDKVVFLSKDETAITTMLQILADEVTPDNGEVNFGITVEKDYLPKDNANYFEDGDVNLVDWLRQYTGDEQAENYVRSFLGKMLFSGQEPLKKVKVLSGGEKVRMMFSKLMLSKANVLVLDQPTNHLDLESIQSVNESLEKYSGSLFFSSHDYSFIESIANKVINLTPQGAFVYEGTFDEYMEDENIKQRVEAMYE